MLFASDLDNTLIHSYKKAKKDDICVEVKDGKELSFMSKENYELLKEVVKKCEFVPVTTRSLEQYQRINLGIIPKYAIVAHGAILLIDGKVDEGWTIETRKLMDVKLPEIIKNDIIFDVRYVDDFFVFGKSESPQKAVEYLESVIDHTKLIACAVHNKVYVLPRALEKSFALKRLKMRINEEFVICSGDSELDISMLEIADIAINPNTLQLQNQNHHKLNEESFSLEMLKKAAELIENHRN
ncbi:MAG: HAD hydrolase family protein [Anaerotignum sp.]|nr:HAD hydrolase family protein [Anaerotignum sp.]